MSDFEQDISENASSVAKEDQVFFLYTQLMDLPFSQIENIIQLEHSLYLEHNANPQDRLAIIGLLQAQIMLGNYEKALSFAYLLWDKGAGLTPTEEMLYINSLINLGLFDMAAQLLKPHMENLSQDIQKFFAVMVKFATMTGNIYALENLLMNPHAPYQDIEYAQLLSTIKEDNNVEYLKNILKIIFESLKNVLCACEYDISASEPQSLEIYLYIRQDKNEIEETGKKLQEKIKNYLQVFEMTELPNFTWYLRPISQHSAMGLD